MLTPYQVQLQKIRNKQVPTGSEHAKLVRSRSLIVKKVDALSYQLLLKQAQLAFNAWIRKRDMEKGCVSCKSKKVVHASHFYAAGSFLGLRFCEDNAHGSCDNCNTFLYGNLEAYRRELKVRIGVKGLAVLDGVAMENKRKKYSRTELLEIIKRYR